MHSPCLPLAPVIHLTPPNAAARPQATPVRRVYQGRLLPRKRNAHLPQPHLPALDWRKVASTATHLPKLASPPVQSAKLAFAGYALAAGSRTTIHSETSANRTPFAFDSASRNDCAQAIILV